MKLEIKSKFLGLWTRYFTGAELPLIFFHSNETHGAELAKAAKGWHCFIGDLAVVRRGEPKCFSKETLGCGKRFLGLDNTLRPHFNEFLSCGIPGQLEGERYKQTPEIVNTWKESVPPIPSDKRYIVFKPWNTIDESDMPEAVVFFATPDVLSGLFTWASFDESNAEAVAAPFGAGCASIVQYPLIEAQKEHPRAILGMFDVSARPRVNQNVLSFAIPWGKFERMLENAEQTFFTTKSWKCVHDRISRMSQESFDGETSKR
jgi:hypothetical protein